MPRDLPGKPLSLWMEAPAPERPPLAGDLDVDVAVLGAGITGMTAALVLARAGRSVVVLEADRVGGGVTGHTTGKVTSAHGLIYATLRDKFGERGARDYGEANQAALEWIAATVHDEGIDCDFRRKPAFTYAPAGEDTSDVRDEVDAAGAAGLPASYTTETDLPYEIAGALRVEDQAEFHARRYALGVTAAAEAAGAEVYERTRATGVDAGDPHAVATPAGTVRARHVIVATNYPFLDRGLFFARLSPQRSYALALEVEGTPPEGMYLSSGSSTRSIRSHPHEGGELLIVGGEGHKVGHGAPTAERYRRLEAWARERFAVRAVRNRWSSQDNQPADSMPYVGRVTPLTDRLLTATGYRKWGLTNGTAAALMLADEALGRPNPWRRSFDSNRLKPLAAAPSLVKENADVGLSMVGDRIRTARPPDAGKLRSGEGAIARLDGRRVAAYRDEEGALHAVSPTCTHLGCLVRFNDAERSWDCPCHGSRFGLDGRVLHGPAVRDLDRVR